MEPLWSPAVATAGNRLPLETAKTSESVATGHRLPVTFHGLALALRGRAVDVGPSLVPTLLCGFAAGFAAVEVALFEVDAAVAAGDAGLVGGGGEGCPGECEVFGRGEAGFDPGAAGLESDRAPEPVAAGEPFEDLGAGGAEVAVSGGVFGEGRCGEGGRLVGEPLLAEDRLCAASGSGPCANRLCQEGGADRGDRAHRVVGALVVPGADPRVEDRVGEREEELDCLVEVV